VISQRIPERLAVLELLVRFCQRVRLCATATPPRRSLGMPHAASHTQHLFRHLLFNPHFSILLTTVHEKKKVKITIFR